MSASQKKHRGGVDDFIEGLKVFDRDGSGQVSAAELRHVLTGLGEPRTPRPMSVLGMNDFCWEGTHFNVNAAGDNHTQASYI